MPRGGGDNVSVLSRTCRGVRVCAHSSYALFSIRRRFPPLNGSLSNDLTLS